MKFLDAAGLQRLWAAITGYVAEQVAGAGGAPSDGYLISTDPNIIVTHEFKAGEDATALAAIPGASNVVTGFVSGTHKVNIPLSLIAGLNAETTMTAGPLPAGKFGTTAGADMLLYTGGVLSYCATDATAILTLSGSPALTADDITVTA